ncbi:replication initiation protein RepC [Paramesorhizobium deserti]|uniref:Replication initiation protein RepC n=1 Tax=Paramesorhizobium deserti TaxID=1494590 RepID=A0A135HXQ2_9HYPH|nr:plasmid replication protein RepC [Paramesorhizobium deserti]KXF77972.1 replication initiation protein RepC [Paramesorhizobium deserti]
MESAGITTPFGRRTMSLAMMASQIKADKIPEGKKTDKWRIYRWLCEGKTIIGVSDRSLAVLNALLSFYPETELSQEHGLVVFPSNAQLALRAHGMADATLRRHLAALVDCGLIIRRDSPNGKRYARRGREGGIDEAFGFSLAPLLARAEEFEQAAERVQAENRALRLARQRITLHRRDIQKLIESAREEVISGPWDALWAQFRVIVAAIPRRAILADLEPIAAQLAALREEIDKLLESHVNAGELSGIESQNERQLSNSESESFNESKSDLGKELNEEPVTVQCSEESSKTYPLDLVLRACPEITDYAASGIANWRDLMATAAQVKGYLGISSSAYDDATRVLGPENAAVTIACIVQRAQHIQSAGAYLRTLTQKAQAGEFSIGPMIMAALKASGTAARMTGYSQAEKRQ